MMMGQLSAIVTLRVQTPRLHPATSILRDPATRRRWNRALADAGLGRDSLVIARRGAS
jgi:hypothetical protein